MALSSRTQWPLAPILRPYLPVLPLIALVGLVASLLEGIGISLLIPLVALLLSSDVPPHIPAPIGSLAESVRTLNPETRVLALSGTLLVLILLKSALNVANNLLMNRVNSRMERDIRNVLCEKLLSLPYEFLLTNDSGHLSKIVTHDGWKVAHAARSALTIVPAIAGLVVFASLLAWLDSRLFAIVTVGAVAVLIVQYSLDRWQRSLSVEVARRYREMVTRTLSIVLGSRAIRLFGQENREGRRFSSASQAISNQVNAEKAIGSFVSPLLELLIAIIFVAILLAAYRLNISAAATTAFLVLLARIQPHAHAISQARVVIASEQGAIKEVEWLLSQQIPGASKSAKRDIGAITSTIRFANVSYSYPDGTIALRDVSVAIRPGVRTALIGKSGSGKSSFVDLVCRLSEPTFGSIFLGDQPISDIDEHSWRSHIAIAGQSVELMQGTIAENIAYGSPGASDEEIREASKAAGVDSFIASLPAGFKTVVGLDGLKLSGGQRQRIGLARALLKRADLLILDEATNAIDAMSEPEVMNLLTETGGFATIIVISHRRSTLDLCDDGIVLDAGMVVEAGPLKNLAYFRRMSGDAE